MVKRSAMQKIEDHEKLCRIMQKQTFQKIESLENRLARLEKYMFAAAFAIIMAVLMNPFK
jgi:hypothetical protein